VQCKYAGVEHGGAIRVNLGKLSGSMKIYATRRYTAAEIDVLAIYVASINRVLWIPPSVWEGRECVYLRLTAARNGQKKGILLVEDYLWR
jgi:hypothetical protein